MSGGSWHRVTDVRAFLSDKGQRRTGPHSFTWKVLHWHACSKCGLLPLKNEATRKAMKSDCVWFEEVSR